MILNQNTKLKQNQRDTKARRRWAKLRANVNWMDIKQTQKFNQLISVKIKFIWISTSMNQLKPTIKWAKRIKEAHHVINHHDKSMIDWH